MVKTLPDFFYFSCFTAPVVNELLCVSAHSHHAGLKGWRIGQDRNFHLQKFMASRTHALGKESAMTVLVNEHVLKLPSK